MSETPASDWPSQLTDRIDRVVSTVRDNATSRALSAIRALAFGLLIVALALTALVLLAAGLVRFTDAYLPGDVWAAHLLIGSLFTIAGALLFSKRHGAAED